MGYLLTKIVIIGAFLLTGWGGYTLSLLLINSFLYKYIDSSIAYYGVQIGCAAGFGLIAVFFFDEVIIIGTSLIGGFLAGHGISQFGEFGKYFPNPFTII